ncbi:hypothetical protein HDU96_002610 [Phlyctochytrium bullatum]|nr:hypothetical protein HDU96_002610 [Phlyctochytrium bullatum]
MTNFPDILNAVSKEQASGNTRYHALYNRLYLRSPIRVVAYRFKKSPTTIKRWEKQFKTTGTVVRRSTKGLRLFGAEKQTWVINYFQQRPLDYLDEAARAFTIKFGVKISISTGTFTSKTFAE